MKTAILVDGGFYQRRAQAVKGKLSAKERADELEAYCRRHLNIRKIENGKTTFEKNSDLYRIFYYDCTPSNKQVFHPFLQKAVDLSKEPIFNYTNDFINSLKKKRKFAIRLGELDDKNAVYTIKPQIVKKLMNPNNEYDFSKLTQSDFKLEINQKGVDMKIGLDIASMSLKKQVDQIVLISGDSDFVPAAKFARREGIDFVLDPLGAPIKDSLHEHIDGLITCDSDYTDSYRKSKNFNN